MHSEVGTISAYELPAEEIKSQSEEGMKNNNKFMSVDQSQLENVYVIRIL